MSWHGLVCSCIGNCAVLWEVGEWRREQVNVVAEEVNGEWDRRVNGIGGRMGEEGEWERRVNSDKVELMATGRKGGRNEGWSLIYLAAGRTADVRSIRLGCFHIGEGEGSSNRSRACVGSEFLAPLRGLPLEHPYAVW